MDRPVVDGLLGEARPAATIAAAGTPLPMEDSIYESRTPLDDQAAHSGETPMFTDPTIPAETGRLCEVPTP
ncbi:hypothetical protein [Agromyces silvae]|uniref:hypothetical protein n=1 Tax=Agromyces silvae TaxID=3388266 RepID=UPI00280B5D73|nr:hypothetical protein [Agromyces protaetiae]